MDAGNSPEIAQAERELVITRTFDAPRSLVFEAWSRSERLSRWWGPRGFTLPVCYVDFRPGGAFRFVMRGPDNQDYPFDGFYREIVAPEKIVFTGKVGRDQILTTVTFAESDHKTDVTVHQAVPSEPEYARGQRQGWTESLDRLAEHFASE